MEALSWAARAGSFRSSARSALEPVALPTELPISWEPCLQQAAVCASFQSHTHRRGEPGKCKEPACSRVGGWLGFFKPWRPHTRTCTYTHMHICTRMHTQTQASLGVMGEASGEELRWAPPAATAGPPLPTALPSAAPGPVARPTERCPTPPAPNRRPPPSSYRYAGQTPHLPRKVRRWRKKLRSCSREPGTRGGDPTSQARPARSPHLARHRLCALTPGRSEGTAGHLLGTRFPTGRSSRFSNKFQGGRRRPKTIQLCKRVRTGRRAPGLTRRPHELGSSRAGGFMGRVTATPGPAAVHLEVH